MLVLTRKPGEKIKIGDGITIQVVAVTGNRVRIGISAPPDVTIMRQELDVTAGELALSVQPDRSEWR